MNTQNITIQSIVEQKETDKEYTITGYLKDVYRTPDGLNLFTITDNGQDTIKLSKFIPGESVFSELHKGQVRTFVFKTKIFRETLQGDLLEVKDASEQTKQSVHEAIKAFQVEKYKPKDDRLLVQSSALEQLKPSMLHVATIIRQAVIEQRPIRITHHGDCDGYAAGVLLEKSIRKLIERYHPTERFVNQYIGRIASRTPFYDVGDATKDINFFLNDVTRFEVKKPLIIVTDNGSTKQDLLSIEKVKLYGADVVVIDHHDPGAIENGKSLICKHVSAHVNPHLLGIKETISASMLCFQVARFVNRYETPDVTVAAIGGVDDWCEGETINNMISQTEFDRDKLKEIGFYVNYEIYLARMNITDGGLFTLLFGTNDKREQLLNLYKPIIEQAKSEVTAVVQKYAEVEQIGNKKVVFLDAEKTTQRGDYFTIGKISDVCMESYDPDIVVCYSDAIIVFRAKETSGFDTNVIVKEVQQNLVHARLTGGGHAVAGSLKFLPAAQEEVLQFIKNQISKL